MVVEVFNGSFLAGVNKNLYLMPRVFYCTKVIWYEGFKLAFGSSSEGAVHSLIEFSTGAKCVDVDELGGKSKGFIEDALFSKFQQKLKERGTTLAELVNNYNEGNLLFVSAWEINLLVQ